MRAQPHNNQMEPTRSPSCAIMSPRHAAHLGRQPADRPVRLSEDLIQTIKYTGQFFLGGTGKPAADSING